MYEQGTYHYVQRQVGQEVGESGEFESRWSDVKFENTDSLWRSRSFGAAEKEITRLRGTYGDDARFRIVKRTFQEQVITPLYFHVDLDASGTGDWQPVTYGDDGDAWRSRVYWKAFHRAGHALAAVCTAPSRVRITRTNDPNFAEVLTWSDFENVAVANGDGDDENYDNGDYEGPEDDAAETDASTHGSHLTGPPMHGEEV